MLCVLFIIGLICLGVMIKKSAPKAAVAKNQIIRRNCRWKLAIAKTHRHKIRDV